jgi:hypothetical protein
MPTLAEIFEYLNTIHIPGPVIVFLVAMILRPLVDFFQIQIKENPIWRVMGLGILSIVSFYFTSRILLHRGDVTVVGVMTLFIGFTVIWGGLFHQAACDFGAYFTKILGGEWWVKGIDYIYLILSFLGLLRVVVGTLDNAAVLSLKNATVVSVLMIAIGVALRITKTTIQIRKWEKLPSS